LIDFNDNILISFFESILIDQAVSRLQNYVIRIWKRWIFVLI